MTDFKMNTLGTWSLKHLHTPNAYVSDGYLYVNKKNRNSKVYYTIGDSTKLYYRPVKVSGENEVTVSVFESAKRAKSNTVVITVPAEQQNQESTVTEEPEKNETPTTAETTDTTETEDTQQDDNSSDGHTGIEE